MIKKLKGFVLASKLTTTLVVILLAVALTSGVFLYSKLVSSPVTKPIQEVDLSFDPEGPYALLSSRKDGNALILSITRVASFEGISYELAYQSDGIDRGVTGDLNTKDRKSDYNQEILFGTCSTTDTFNIKHCVFDKNVENGTLILRIRKPSTSQDKVITVYKMITTWHLQQPAVALGVLTSGDNHFSYTVGKTNQGDLNSIGFSIINDLSGAPKLLAGKQVLGKVYSVSLPVAKTLPPGKVSIELSDNPPPDAKIYQYLESKNNWQELDTKVAGSILTAQANGSGIFAVLIPTPK